MLIIKIFIVKKSYEKIVLLKLLKACKIKINFSLLLIFLRIYLHFYIFLTFSKYYAARKAK